MGGCVSLIPSSEPPRCRICRKEGGLPWSQLSAEERDKWVWHDGKAACRSCMVNERMEKLKFQKARRVYKKAKAEAYPPPSEGLRPMHSIKSGHEWERSRSFLDSWRPPSSLQRLMSAIRHAQEEEPGKYVGMQRKPTGYVPPTATPAGPQVGGEPAGSAAAASAAAAAAAAAAGAPADWQQQLQQQQELHQQVQQQFLAVQQGYAELAALEEEEGVELVEEEELSLARTSAAGSWHGGEAAREPRQPRPAPPPLKQQQGGQGAAVLVNGDSAYDGQAEEAAAASPTTATPWVSSTA